MSYDTKLIKQYIDSNNESLARILFITILEIAGEYEDRFNQYSDEIFGFQKTMARSHSMEMLSDAVRTIMRESIKQDIVQSIEIKTRFKEDYER